MINVSTLQQDRPIYAPKIEQKTDKTFEELLSGAVAQQSDSKEKSAAEKALTAMKKQVGTYDPHDKTPVEIPEKWTGGDGTLGVKNALKFLEEQGIDFDEVILTHNITEEQREWLSSRHDLENMSLNLSDDECQNLYADLMILGVCSFDEIKKLFQVQMPEEGVLIKQVRSSDIGIDNLGIGKGLKGVNSLKHTYQTTFDMQSSIISAILNNAGSLSALSGIDKKFVDSANELLSQKQGIYDILLGLFE